MNRSGNHEMLSADSAFFLFLFLFQMQNREKFQNYAPIFFLLKILCNTICQDLPNALHLKNFFFCSIHQLVWILKKGLCQHSTVANTDSLYSQTIKKSTQIGSFSLFDIFLNFLKGLYAKALHTDNFFPILFQGKEIRKLLDKASAQPFFQGHLGKSLDIQGISTDK